MCSFIQWNVLLLLHFIWCVRFYCVPFFYSAFSKSFCEVQISCEIDWFLKSGKFNAVWIETQSKNQAKFFSTLLGWWQATKSTRNLLYWSHFHTVSHSSFLQFRVFFCIFMSFLRSTSFVVLFFIFLRIQSVSHFWCEWFLSAFFVGFRYQCLIICIVLVLSERRMLFIRCGWKLNECPRTSVQAT